MKAGSASGHDSSHSSTPDLRAAIPDDELLRRLVDRLRHSRRTEADLVAHVGEVDARRLYVREASPSMNIALACHAHNRYLAEVDFGRKTMARHRGSRRNVVETAPASSP